MKMALNIKDPETDRLARRLAAATGESVTVAVRNALLERIERLPKRSGLTRFDELMAIGRRCAAISDVDRRSPDEILGYGDDGLPT
jgi:antitoxin VapB